MSSDAAILWCNEISTKFDEFSVYTTFTSLTSIMKEMSMESIESQKNIYKESLLHLMKYTRDELVEHKDNNTPEYTTWANYVVVFYTIRYVFMKKSIPIIK